jgi:hypothetical protein
MTSEQLTILFAIAFILLNCSYIYSWAMAATYYEGTRVEILLQALVFHRNKFKPEGLVYRRRMICHQVILVTLFLLYGALVLWK